MSPDAWLRSLDPAARDRAGRFIDLYRRLGAPDPVAFARLDLEKDRPQLARFLLLRHCWTEAIDPWRDDLSWVANLIEESGRDPTGQFADAGRALARLRDLGADPADIGALARFVAYEAVFSLIHTLDEGYDPEHDGTLPGWALRERDPLGQVTDRTLDRLHVSLPDLDPSGRQGRPNS